MDAIWRLKFENTLGIPRICNKGILEVTDHDLALLLPKYKMAVKRSGEAKILFKISIQRFSRSLIKVFLLDF